MTAADLTLLTDWDGTTSLRGWYASEKLDGCRGYWDGARMWTRGGKEVKLPDRIRQCLPALPLEGEIHAGRGGFETARLAVQNGQWTPEVRFTAFDAPTVQGDWHERVTSIRSDLRIVHWTFKGDPFAAMLNVQLEGGEGLVFRKPGQPYRAGRDRFSVRVK